MQNQVADFFGKPRAKATNGSDEENDRHMDDMEFASGHHRRGFERSSGSASSSKRLRSSPLSSQRLSWLGGSSGEDELEQDRASSVAAGDQDQPGGEEPAAEDEPVKGKGRRKSGKGAGKQRKSEQVATPAQCNAAEKLRNEFNSKKTEFALEAARLGFVVVELSIQVYSISISISII